ncbi:MAG TPA: hypothetical protein VGU25_15215 [Acidobacteriaceae bacterium]|nr:hypothetical protein [Acidobacteriaceae bacterium]
MAVDGDLVRQLREVASRCENRPNAALESLPAGFQHIDDVIVLLQPLRIAAEDAQDALLSTLQRLAEKNFLTATQSVGEGGVWAALLCGCAGYGYGFHAELSESEGATAREALLGEGPSRVLVSARPKAHLPLANFVERGGRFTAEAIGRVTSRDIRVHWMGQTLFEAASLDELTLLNY